MALYSDEILRQMRREFPAIANSGKYMLSSFIHPKDQSVTVVCVDMLGLVDDKGMFPKGHFTHDHRDSKFNVREQVARMFRDIKDFVIAEGESAMDGSQELPAR